MKSKASLKKLLEDHSAYSPELYKILLKEFGLDLAPLEDRKSEFMESLRPFVQEYGRGMVFDFFTYWSSYGEKDKKMKFEKQQTFNINLRLKKWKENNIRFKIVNMLNKK